MSGGDKIALFGSFTEDETKLFQGQAGKSDTKSVEKTWELSEIQFWSLNFSVLSLEKTSNPITKGVVHPAKSTYGQNKAITKDNACSNKKEAVTSSLPNGGPVLLNGCPSANVSPNNGVLKNVKKTEAAVPSSVPVKNVSSSGSAPLARPEGCHDGIKSTQNRSSAPLARPEVYHDGIKSTQNSSSVKEITENGSPVVYTPIIAAPVVEVITSLNNKAFPNKPLLPHGLRNTGNICFLNATLQAFLSYLPFVQLLQDLRKRSIPKAGYPTLSAFVEFISQFDVLDESNMNKNEKVAVISAKTLNPAVFDPVLRIFTPDVPAGTSARPRQEDAQEFLSFAMDRMHDELLKLNGNGSNSKEGMVVSSADDDAWETVGRKNKSAIMRSQSFVPSELSAIFGGQLHSTVKAAGNKASVTVQPFLLLHLDIFPDAVQMLDDALYLFSAPESLEGYKTAAGNQAEDEDIISTLTDDILLSILVRVDLVTAARTSVLSKRWRHLPWLLPDLNFNVKDFLCDPCPNPIEAQHMDQAMTSLTKAARSFLADSCNKCFTKLGFQLYLIGNYLCDIGLLVSGMIDSGMVVELDFAILDDKEPYECEDKGMLQQAWDVDEFFNTYPSLLRCLTKLFLKNMRFAQWDMNNFLFDCCKELKHLCLYNCDVGDRSVWQINAPNSKLRVLEIDSTCLERVEVLCLPSLERLRWDTWFYYEESLRFGFVPSLEELHLVTASTLDNRELSLSEILHGTTNMHTLTLDFQGEKLWIQPEGKQLCIAFNKLRKLSLCGIFVEFDLLWTLYLLEAAPSVEIFHVEIWEHPCRDGDPDRIFAFGDQRIKPSWKMPVFSCSMKWQLKELQFVGFRPLLEQHMLFVMAIMERAPNLKTILLIEDVPCEDCESMVGRRHVSKGKR